MTHQCYDQQYFHTRDHLDLHIAHTIKIFMQENSLRKVLDVGCGSGRLVKFLNDHKFDAVGCDIETEALKLARKINPSKIISKASADKLPFRNNSFDLITSISVIEHLTKKRGGKFLSESFRLLKKGGFVFIITPNYHSPMRMLLGQKWFGYCDPTHKYFYTPKSLTRILKRKTFHNIRLRFKSAYNLDFDWHIPKFLRPTPMFIKNLLNYLMISSPLSTYRDSFWIAGEK